MHDTTMTVDTPYLDDGRYCACPTCRARWLDWSASCGICGARVPLKDLAFYHHVAQHRRDGVHIVWS